MTSNKGKIRAGWRELERKHPLKNSFIERVHLQSRFAWIAVELKTQDRLNLDPLVCRYSPGAIAPAHVMSFQCNE